MNSTTRIPVPAAWTSLATLLWEIAWKNRILPPALGVLLAVGGIVAGKISDQTGPRVESLQVTGLVAFLSSLLLAFSPFTLMESHGSWRMNSMISRWFVLPIPAWMLALAPLALGWLTVLALLAAWIPVLWRLLPGMDFAYLALLLPFLVTLVQILAWTMHRKPAQFWVSAAALGVVSLWVITGPMETHGWEDCRLTVMTWLASGIVLGTAAAVWLARQNRIGTWPGGLSIDDWMRRPVGRERARRPHLSSLTAMLKTDVFPLWRAFLVIWALMAVGICALHALNVNNRSALRDWRFFPIVASFVLPTMAVIFLAHCGLALACEGPGMLRTRLGSYRATLPLSDAAMFTPRLIGLTGAWLMVWVPLLVIIPVASQAQHTMDGTGFLGRDLWLMAISAHAMVGALPLLLWGRLDGLPNMLVPTLVSWSGTCALVSWLRPDEVPAPATALLLTLLALKVALAAAGFARSVRRSEIPLGLAVGSAVTWICFAGGMAAIATRQSHEPNALAVIILIPLARLAWCPAAIGANRRR